MRKYTSKNLCRAAVFAAVLSGSTVLSADVAAQEGGKSGAFIPDFYQSGIGWITKSNDFYPPKGGLGPVTFDPAHPYVMNGGGATPTFRIADITHPALMPWIKDALRKVNETVLAGHALYTTANTCRPDGVPNILLVRATPFFLVQTPKEVWLIWQNDHMVRRVYLDQQHTKNPKPSWFGESVGHYEGDSLVVDTVGMNAKTTVNNYHTPHTDKLHVVERYHMVEGGRILQVDVTVDDPGAFTRPWNAMQRYGRVDFKSRRTPGLGVIAGDAEPFLSEEICAETAVSPIDIGVPPVPQSDRPDF